MTDSETIARIEQRWLQVGLSTFFWAGVVNASFAAGGLWAIYQCNQVYEKALIVQQENVKAERELRDIVLKARSERLQAEHEFNEAVRWWREVRGK